MNKQEREEYTRMMDALRREDVDFMDTAALQSISKTLRRWYEAECGNEFGAIERDEETGIPFYRSALPGGAPYRVRDLEKGALKRLATIMARYPHLKAYVQRDPRGCALYVLPAGVSEDACHNGIAVY